MRDIQSPVGNVYFQPEAFIHTYGALPTAVLSKIYSGVYQLKYDTSLLRVQDNIILPNLVWRDYRALFRLSRGWQPAHTISTHLQPFLFMAGGTRLDIIVHVLIGCYACHA